MIAGLAVTFLLGSAAAGLAQTVDTRLWVTNGVVGSIVRDAGTIYIGGLFTRVGPATGGGVAIDASTGAAQQPYPRVAGYVRAVAPDGSGGWYLGGSFTSVRGQPRNNLAQLDAAGNLTGWSPDANGEVRALAVSGGTVYAGGQFTSIGGQPRNNIAALDAMTGAATAWDPNAAGSVPSFVHALAVSGGTVYASGYFASIGGQPRNNFAALDAATGAATAWNPNLNGGVSALAVSGGTVYAGGQFSSIGGQPRNNIAALDAATGAATAWDPNPSGLGGVDALAVSGGTVYAGGEFNFIGGQPRNNIAALDAATGAATAWDPNAAGPPPSSVSALAVSGGTVYAGGDFDSIGGQSRNFIAALDAATGAATAWNPNLAGSYPSGVSALAVSGGMVYAGGRFATIGGQARNHIAALDAATGAVTAWDPNPNDAVSTLAMSGGTLYVGGWFTSIGGQPRNKIVALDAATGAATAWNPNAAGYDLSWVNALAVSGGTVYAGGEFDSIGGQARNNIAALDAATGAATAWDPNATGGYYQSSVFTLAVSGGTVYAGGYFDSIGGQMRKHVAALDATTGAATAWNPDADGAVSTLAMSGGTLYAGGWFTSIGGQSRNKIAALDAATGAATAWDPNARGGYYQSSVFTLAVSGGTVYAGGDFTSIGGQARNHIAALDAATGAATAWSPDADGNVFALTVSGGTVYAGGDFTSIGGQPQSSIAAMGDVTTPTLLSLVSVRTAPDRVELTWFAPAGDAPSATVYRRTLRCGWDALGQVRADGTGYLVYQDTHVTAGTRYGYRLGVRDAGGEVVLGETWVDVPSRLELTLAGPASIPARGALRIAFSLPEASPARLELFDVGGRRIALREVGGLGAGSHVVTLGDARTLPSGVYLLRLTQGSRSLSARAVFLR